MGRCLAVALLGRAASLPASLRHGLSAAGVPRADGAGSAALPPVALMFAALLGYNPVRTLLGHAISKLPAGHAAYLTGHTFFPSLISAPFQHGLAIAFDFAIAACLIAGVASLLRRSRYVHELHGAPEPAAMAAHDVTLVPAEPVATANGRRSGLIAPDHTPEPARSR